MGTKNSNPYREGSAYNAVLGEMKKQANRFTKTSVIAKLKDKATAHDFNVINSPRNGKWGNASAKGDKHFSVPLKKKEVGEEKSFKLGYYAPNAKNVPTKPVRKTIVASEKVATVEKTEAKPATKKRNKVTA